MIDQNGNEIILMSKEEADASVEEMTNMIEFFDGICEYCGEKRMNCDYETCKSFDEYR